jgi:DNA-binding NarL/FixJ family response regulator
MQDTFSLQMLEAACNLSESAHQAMRRVAGAASGVVPRGPISVVSFDTDAGFDPSSVHFERAEPRYVLRFLDWQRASSAAERRRVLALPPGVVDLHADDGTPSRGDYLAGARTVSSLYVMANTGDGGGLHIIFGNPDVPDWPPAQLRQLAQVAAHLAAAWRVRGALAVPAPDQVLRQAVVAQSARAAGHDAPAGQVLWPALLAGQWSLLDAFTAAGARHVVAYRNPDTAAPLRTLLPREQIVLEHALAGRSGKWIAFELDRSESAVARTLRAALRKLGAADTAALAGAQTAGFARLHGVAAGVEIAFARLPHGGRALDTLSDAERAIVTDLLGGKRAIEIAHHRGTSRRTVAHQIASVYRKLGASSRRELLALLS